MGDPFGNASGGGYDPRDGRAGGETGRSTGATDDDPPEGGLSRAGLFDGLPDPVIVVDPGTERVLAVNEATVDLLGYDRNRLVGTDVTGIHPASETDRYRDLIDRTVEAGDLTAARVDDEGEYHLVDADGVAIPVEVSASRVTLDGRTCVVGTYRDVSGRKHRERVLEELHGTTRKLLGATTQESIARSISEVADEVLELPIHAVMLYDEGSDTLEQAALSDAAVSVYDDACCVERGEAVVWDVFETGEPRVHGDVREAPAVYNPETDIRSEFVVPIGEFGVFVASSTVVDDFDAADVTLGKVLAANAEVALDRLDRERQLRDQTQKLETIVGKAPVVLFALDADGTFTLSRGRALEGMGLEPGEAVGQSLFDLYEGYDGIQEDCQRALDGENVSSTREVGNQVYETWYQPVERDGEVTEVIGVAIKITERERRERLVRVLNRFLRHNLRNAMNVMVGYAERLDGHEDPQVQRAVDQIAETGDDLTRLSEKARRLGQMAGTEGETDVVGVRRSIDRIVEDLEASHDAEFVRESVDSGPTPVDETVELALREICENAVKHSTGPSPTTEVSVTDEVGSDRVVVEVSDDGPGIPRQERAVLDSEGETPLNHGSGLGLFVAYWAVTDVGGDIEVPEAGPDGTTVRVRIPVATEEE